MHTASLYSQIDPFERLSRPLNELLPNLTEGEEESSGVIVEVDGEERTIDQEAEESNER